MAIGASFSPGRAFVRSLCRSDGSPLSLNEMGGRSIPRTSEGHGYLE